jgi:hypothetical protein
MVGWKTRLYLYVIRDIILKNRYLYEKEPIQYGLFRIAMILSARDDHPIDLQMLRLMYDLISTGMFQVSSILAYADRADDTVISVSSDCSKTHFDKELVKQMTEIECVICFGVGVAMEMGTVHGDCTWGLYMGTWGLYMGTTWGLHGDCTWGLYMWTVHRDYTWGLYMGTVHGDYTWGLEVGT